MTINSKRYFAAIIAGFRIAAHQDVLAAASGFGASDLGGGAPDHLRVMADIFHPAGDAVIRERARPEVFLFADPGIHHRFGAEIAFGAGPEIFALRGDV